MNQEKETTTQTLIAVDIAKDSLALRTEEKAFSLSNDKAGLRKLLALLKKMPAPFVVCEASGGYERALMEALHQSSLTVALVNPARVRAFAQSEGIKAKTDPIDAEMLLRFAREKKPRPTPPPDPAISQLAALLDRRSHLTEQLAREKNRLQISPSAIHPSIRRMIAFVEKELDCLNQQVRSLVSQTPHLHSKAGAMLSVCGVGEVTAWTILAYLSEISHLGRNQLVALAGVAPFNRDSGKSSKRRSICAGRSKVRKCLYMAAQSAAVHNPVISPYVKGLIARGKPYKCAIVAAMRKLLIHLLSLLKNPSPSLCLAK
jgi:transposase